MSSLKQTIANRANAQKSTGPRGPEGKRASAPNATKHGLFAQNTPVREEERPVLMEFSAQIHADPAVYIFDPNFCRAGSEARATQVTLLAE